MSEEISILTTSLAIFLCSTIIYYAIKIYWEHRKRRQIINLLPGPPTVPLLGNSLSFIGDTRVLIKVFNKWIKLYGTPFRIWVGFKPQILINEPEDVQLILSTYAVLDRGTQATRILSAITGTGLLSASPNKWKVTRRLISPTFSKPILESFMPIFVTKTKLLIRCLEKHVDNGIFDIWSYLCKQSLDIICASAMGVETNCQTQRNEYAEVAKTTVELSAHRFAKIWLHPKILFDCTAYGQEFKRCIQIVKTFGENVLKNRKLMTEENKFLTSNSEDTINERPRRKVFLDHFREICEANPTFTERDLLDEIDTMIIAGFETTALTNATVLLMLAIHQDIQKEAYNEIYEIFGDSDRDITLGDLTQLRYLEMVIKETLRIYPTAHLLQRYVDQECKLTTCKVPKGTTITIWLRSLHMNPKHWHESEKFDPLRFLPEEIQKRHSHSFIPFGAGPRNCIGLKYAYMSMKVTLATILRKYYLTTNVKQEDIELESTITLRSAIGYPVELHSRENFIHI